MSTNYGNPLDPAPEMVAALMQMANTNPNMNQSYYYDGSGNYNPSPVNPFLNNGMQQGNPNDSRRNSVYPQNPQGQYPYGAMANPPQALPQNSLYPQNQPLGGLNAMVDSRRNMPSGQPQNQWGANNTQLLSQQLPPFGSNGYGDYTNYGMPLPGQTQTQQQFMYERFNGKVGIGTDVGEQKLVPAPVINWEQAMQQQQFQNQQNQNYYGGNTYAQPQYPVQQNYGNVGIPADKNWKEIAENNWANL
jgi:hypothetical protein